MYPVYYVKSTLLRRTGMAICYCIPLLSRLPLHGEANCKPAHRATSTKTFIYFWISIGWIWFPGDWLQFAETRVSSSFQSGAFAMRVWAQHLSARFPHAVTFSISWGSVSQSQSPPEIEKVEKRGGAVT